jgi:K+-sensing histidine kinase KdpD
VVLKFLPMLFVGLVGWFFVRSANFGPFNASGGSLYSCIGIAASVALFSFTGVEALRDRMAGGQIYTPPEAEAALGGSCQTGNLSVLRELTLLLLAATLASDPRRHCPGGHDPGNGHARDRVPVALSGDCEGELLIRRAARIAARFGGDPLAKHATWPGRPERTGCAVLAAQRQLIGSLGGTYEQLADQDIPARLAVPARRRSSRSAVGDRHPIRPRQPRDGKGGRPVVVLA